MTAPQNDDRPAGAWERIKQHKVIQWTVAYAAAGFALLQGLDIAAGAFDWPKLAVRLFMVGMVVGVPIVATLAWYHGHRGQQRAGKTELLLLGVLLTVAAGIVWLTVRSAPDVPAVVALPETSSAFAPPARSVAVLSFVNSSGDPGDEYFSDGLAEELLNALTRINELRVAARTSSFSFKGATIDIPTVGRKLNVGAVLEGSVRRGGDRLRISARLISAVTGYNLWSDSFDRSVDDVFAVQTEIATRVADAMKVTLLGAARAHLQDGGTQNSRALDAYLRGRKLHSESSEEGRRMSVAAFEEAIMLDPQYALAHSRLAEDLLSLASDWIPDADARAPLFARARALAERAVTLAPAAGQVHAGLGLVLNVTTLDFAAVDASYRRALTLEPGNAELNAVYAGFAGFLGRADAIETATRAVQLNPLDPGAHRIRGINLMYAGRFDEARESLRETLRLEDGRYNRIWAAEIEIVSGNAKAAIALCEPDRDSWYGQLCLAIAYFHAGRRHDAEEMLQKMMKEQGELSAYQYAEVYAEWGDKDKALDWLEKAFALKDAGLSEVKVDPFLRGIRGTPRYQRIIEQLHFPA